MRAKTVSISDHLCPSLSTVVPSRYSGGANIRVKYGIDPALESLANQLLGLAVGRSMSDIKLAQSQDDIFLYRETELDTLQSTDVPIPSERILQLHGAPESDRSLRRRDLFGDDDP